VEEEEEELEFTLPRLVGEGSREDDAARRFPPLRVVTMAADRRREAQAFPQKAKETEWKPKPPWIFFDGGKMAEPVGFY
jgi:hypothetical protein